MSESTAEKAAPASNTNDPDAKKKPGNPGDFHGQRLAFLESKYGSYRLASEMGPNTVRDWYRDSLFPEWWRKFHWSLDIDAEPSSKDVFPDETNFTPIQKETKARTMTSMVKKVKAWFNHRRNAANLNSQKNPWTPWLKQLRMSLEAPPRRFHDYQFYMKHPSFKEKVTEEFDKAWALETDQSAANMMKVRCREAKKLLRKEPIEVRAALDVEAEEAYQLAKQKYDLGISAQDYTSAEAQDAAIDTLVAVVQPLLDGIRSHTGMFIGMVAVSPHSDSSQTRCTFLSSGRSDEGKDFPTQDPAGFRMFSKLFIRWCSVAAGDLPPSALQGNPPRTDPGAIPSSSNPATPSKAASSSTHAQLNANAVASSTHAHLDTNLKRSIEAIAERIRSGSRLQTPPNEHLLLSIARMVPQAKENRIKELCAMEQYEFDRANMIASNNAELAKLGFKAAPPMNPSDDNDEPEDERAYVPETPTVSTPSAPRRQPRRAAAQAQPTPGDKDSGVAPVARKAPPVPPPSTPTNNPPNNTPSSNDSTRPSSPQANALIPAGDEGSSDDMAVDPIDPLPVEASVGNNNSRTVKEPAWFTSAFSKFEAVDASVYGDQWFPLVRAWKDIEVFYRYETNGTALPNTSRPPQVRLWIKSARYKNVYDKIPALDVKLYEKQWWLWWLAINPTWRTRTGKGRLSKGGSGSWDAVTVPGLNGLLSVVVSLWWWREKLADTSPFLSSWHEAVADVAYALGAARDGLSSQNAHRPSPAKKRRLA